MKNLSALTPAETLLVLEGQNATLKELLKLTFMDLLLKQVIQIEEVQRQPSQHDPVRIYKYVVAGKNFRSYQALNHESVFLEIFKKEFRVQVLFQNLVRIGFEKAKSQERYHASIIKSSVLNGHVTKSLVQTLMGGFTITPSGFELRKNLKTEIALLEKQFSNTLEKDPQKALEILRQIKGNIFLLTTIDFELMKQLDAELMEQFKEYKREESTSGCTGCTTWTSFDSGCSSSGCSGDSGCSSGCSGCGGGCGGD